MHSYLSLCFPISIHATHTGGDSTRAVVTAALRISIHATHTGGDFKPMRNGYRVEYFNPRHPHGWRLAGDTAVLLAILISIHATHTGGDRHCQEQKCTLQISIHATHTGGDTKISSTTSPYSNFNPRHPHGWRPEHYVSEFVRDSISIHATHTGGDSKNTQNQQHYHYDRLSNIIYFRDIAVFFKCQQQKKILIYRCEPSKFLMRTYTSHR